MLDHGLESEQIFTRRCRAFSIPMASSRRGRKEEHHLREPLVIDVPHKNLRTAILMAPTLLSHVLRHRRCMATCQPSTATPSMTRTIIPHPYPSSIFVNHRQAVLPPPRTELTASKYLKPTSNLSLRTPLSRLASASSKSSMSCSEAVLHNLNKTRTMLGGVKRCVGTRSKI